MRTSFAEMHPELVCEWSERNVPLRATDVHTDLIRGIGG